MQAWSLTCRLKSPHPVIDLQPNRESSLRLVSPARALMPVSVMPCEKFSERLRRVVREPKQAMLLSVILGAPFTSRSSLS